ncbi:ABC transporter ATP-binding protein [Corynebacterium guangdongense]|uniref:ABC transport system ATP-binding protein n=1 Tax=Corynebacterium guangdongense TaxID=1783348 RepID=A0ABU2A051_9CORY|nr:ABC transporter ATP-binding protein [Corynebacterium guangdongense]MDR7330554.1 putative ABC transport system ATP-binding protein [Corynebacterium guangdongense]WJZ19108.1 Lipoprotein-releasing system ATP-binding protein LolD [Corynebacterium guangdongense]
MSVLKIEHATVTYPDGNSTVIALDHADLHVSANELHAIVGESGSGKSTLLAVAGLLTVPESGSVSLVGHELADADDTLRTAMRREHIGVVFQQDNMLPALNVRDQLLITDHIRGQKPRPTRADDLLARVGLAGQGDRRIGRLSGGQRQRVAIARALMGEPDLLLADEPTSALDAANSRSIIELFREVVDETGVACAIVTHDRSLLDVMDTVSEVTDGRTRVRATAN